MATLLSIITAPLSLIVGFVFIFFKRGRARLPERFGRWNLKLDGCLWFHGASLGEMTGLVPVITEAKTCFACPILVTATSVTGLDRVKNIADEVRLLPFDSNIWLKRALNNVRPRALIVTETELWPVFLSEISRKAIPMLLINARISDYSFPWYRRFRWIVGPLLKKYTCILAGSQISAERFVALGMDDQSVKMTGNSKYDFEVKASAPDLLFENEVPVLILASLRPGEEKLWFPQLRGAFESGVPIGVIVAPRHQEKFQYFELQCQHHQLPYTLWTKRNEKQKAGSVLILDAMGVLPTIYTQAEAVFVGGTLEDYGGHNPLEPAACKVCPIVGPYHSNVSDVVESMRAKQAIVEVKEPSDLQLVLSKVQNRDSELKQVGQRAYEVWESSKGATSKIIEQIEQILR